MKKNYLFKMSLKYIRYVYQFRNVSRYEFLTGKDDFTQKKTC